MQESNRSSPIITAWKPEHNTSIHEKRIVTAVQSSKLVLGRGLMSSGCMERSREYAERLGAVSSFPSFHRLIIVEEALMMEILRNASSLAV